jgi:hypothetical protein
MAKIICHTLLHDNRIGTIINSSAGNTAKLAERGKAMVTIKNINETYGGAVEFSAETVELAVREMKDAIAESFGECDDLVEGVDFEVVS